MAAGAGQAHGWEHLEALQKVLRAPGGVGKSRIWPCSGRYTDAVQLQKVVRHRHQRPFAAHLFDPAQ
jgi:hypothetical protein